MSFGFSVGDFLAVGGLIVKIVDTLHGTKSEYQELIRELERYAQSLSAGLLHISSASSSARTFSLCDIQLETSPQPSGHA